MCDKKEAKDMSIPTKKEKATDLNQVWKNSIKLTGKEGIVILNPKNKKHQEWYEDRDDE